MPPQAKRKPNATSFPTPHKKKSTILSASRSHHDHDFIMTFDSDDDVPDLDAASEADPQPESDSEPEPEPTSTEQHDKLLTKNQRKRKQKAHLVGKEKIIESASLKNISTPSKADGLALDKQFEFDIFGDGSGADYEAAQRENDGKGGWDMNVTGTRMHKKLNVDDIIEKRRKALPKSVRVESDQDQDEDESASEASDDLDDHIKNAEYQDSEEDEDQMDRFVKMATHVEADEHDQDAAQVDSQEDPLSSDQEADSDDDDTQNHHDDDDDDDDDDDEESNSSQDDSDSETEAEKAKKAAFFAEEPATTASKTKFNNDQSSSFSTFSLSRPVLRALSSLSFHKPTPIQSRTIPIALAGKDIVAGAVTGSGKTAAFMIPTIERLTWRAKSHHSSEAKSRVLILAPTRELAIQCYSVGKSIAKFTDIRFCLCVGGLSVKSQEAELKLRPEVVIATPGRLIDHVRNSASFTLDDIEILVMDEADRMLEDGFADELNEIVKCCPRGARQTMLFSATMTDDVEQLVRLSLKRPVRLFVDPKRTTAKKLIQEFVRVRGTSTGGVAGADGLAGVQNLSASTSSTINGAMMGGKKSEDAVRPALLLALCTRTFTSQTMIFVRSKKLAHQLKIVFGLLSLSAGELHGDLSQEQRIEALTSFRDGKVDFLIATDLASRGLDIKGVQTVINYDMPGQFEAYLHRVGRTARAGRNGRAVTLVGEADRRMLKLAIKKSSAEQIKHRIIPTTVANKMMEMLQELKPEVDAVLREEKEEQSLRLAEMELKKGENMAVHAEEIFSRPKRTWFQSGTDKEAAAVVSKAAYDASMTSKEANKIKQGRDKYSGLSRKKRRSKMMREEIERENKEAMDSLGAKTVSGTSLDAGIRAAKKAQRPTKLGVVSVKVQNKSKAKNQVGSRKSAFGGGATRVTSGNRNKIKSSFSRDLGDKRR
ncbi:related to DRS1 - RNA helicase of the DEAD box family [Melanopsichium pennsylvanicum]|uniref:RNA helicase n=2 Tax=Melanopsichium pennsylvanicum TaxID=63383 RepID=A0AAJ4XNH2_9BASI|nr:related to DRS1-RNA helicase of the DEAD box family [Melanopsichium pennsylvanicum 4]SNX85086.1 related to DRS1 - RNA helicase of the DEAD box family [Melanopsichium pennsylvanicum]